MLARCLYVISEQAARLSQSPPKSCSTGGPSPQPKCNKGTKSTVLTCHSHTRTHQHHVWSGICLSRTDKGLNTPLCNACPGIFSNLRSIASSRASPILLERGVFLGPLTLYHDGNSQLSIKQTNAARLGTMTKFVCVQPYRGQSRPDRWRPNSQVIMDSPPSQVSCGRGAILHFSTIHLIKFLDTFLDSRKTRSSS